MKSKEYYNVCPKCLKSGGLKLDNDDVHDSQGDYLGSEYYCRYCNRRSMNYELKRNDFGIDLNFNDPLSTLERELENGSKRSGRKDNSRSSQ